MNNKVIKVLDGEHGKKVINFWKQYCDTGELEGTRIGFYYGIINGVFNFWGIGEVLKFNAEIIKLPEEKTIELPLKGKYLKYSPEITFEVFKLVWDKLISLGYKSFNSYSVEYRYDEFKGKYPYFKESTNIPLEFNCYNAIRDFKETTVQEILGYNPFIKETTTVKDWNKVTEEELLEEAKRRYPVGCKVKLISRNTGGDFKNEVRFTKYKFYGNSKRKQLFVDGNLLLFHEGVWAEIKSIPEVEAEEIIPEYIECIKPQCGYFIPGNIYKVLDTEHISCCKIISNIKCSDYEPGHGLYVSLTDTSYFKPSTKEAYDAQNKVEEKFQFIVGKWYKCKDYDYIIKYFGIEKSKHGNAVLYSDLIDWNKNYKSYPEGVTGVGYAHNKHWCELTDLSEIQQYLPDGHIDKIVKHDDKQISEEPTRPKSVKEWSVDTCGVIIANKSNITRYKPFKIGFIDKIVSVSNNILVEFEKFLSYKPYDLSYSDGVEFKRFATKAEAEEFAKSLVTTLKQAVHCKTIEEYKFTKEKLGAPFYKNAYIKEGSVITLDKIGCTISLDNFVSEYSDYKLLSFQEWCDLNGYKMKVEQPLKQVVQCTTHEEWDFVISKLSSSSKLSRQRNKFEKFIKENPNGIAINTVEDLWSDIDYWKEEGYQILSFQKWCGLNEYKMESKQPLKQMDNSRIFEVGDYVVITKSNINWISRMDSEIGKVVKITEIDSDGYITYRGEPKWSFGVYDNHFRHATQEEIEDLKTVSTGILDESYIGKFISFNCGKCFYDEALIIRESGYIYLLNNCYSNNNGHINKSIYKYSLKFSNLAEVESICTDIKLLNTEEVLESQYQKSVQPDGLRLKTKNSHITIDYIKIEPKERTKLREFEFNYFPEPE